jgi:hypothetical protein
MTERTFHDHCTPVRKLYSVTQGGETIAIAKPLPARRGWWILEGRGVCWINPAARDLSLVREDGFKPPTGMSAYERTPRFMLVKGVADMRREMQGLVDQGTK